MKLFKTTRRCEIESCCCRCKLLQIPESKLIILYLGAFNAKLASTYGLWTTTSDLTSSTNHHSTVKLSERMQEGIAGVQEFIGTQEGLQPAFFFPGALAEFR